MDFVLASTLMPFSRLLHTMIRALINYKSRCAQLFILMISDRATRTAVFLFFDVAMLMNYGEM